MPRQFLGSINPEADMDMLEDMAKAFEKQAKEREAVSKFTESVVIDSTSSDQIGAKDARIRESLAKMVRDAFNLSEAGRRNIERDWISSLQQYKGVYEPDVLARIRPNRSRAFVRITRNKVRTVDSRLSDLLFPANGDKNWDVIPTPIPEFSPEYRQQFIEAYQQETGQELSPEKLALLMSETAEGQAKKMSKVIHDQLAELKYREIVREVIHSGNIYGTGILKGPLVSLSENRQYYKSVKEDGSERWLLKEHDRIIPFVENVRIWDIYPDMEATNFQDCRYIVQRRKMNKHELLTLANRQDFNGKTIRSYLNTYPDGAYEKKEFEIRLQTIGDIISNAHADSPTSKKYEVLEYWGYVSTDDLRKFGVTIPAKNQDSLEIPANIWVLGDRVIKSSISPIEGLRWPYYVYYYDKDETSPFGEGIPQVMRDIQELTNSAFRAMLDNAAISAGPQIEVNMDLISEDEDIQDVYPFKTWMRTGQGMDASNPAVRMIPLPSYTMEFERMLNIFGQYADEVTTIPRHMWGESTPGVGRTASGMSMLMGSANVSIKDQVKNFDDGITKPFISAMYHWNMQFNQDEDIKGDYGIVARGSVSLIAKEVYTQALLQFTQLVSNPMDAEVIKRAALIRKIAEALDLNTDTFVMTDEEIAAQTQQQQQLQSEQKEFMNNIIEAAREQGVSPEALLGTFKEAFASKQESMQEGAK